MIGVAGGRAADRQTRCCLQFQSLSPWLGSQGAGQQTGKHGAEAGTESSQLYPQVRGRKLTGPLETSATHTS